MTRRAIAALVAIALCGACGSTVANRNSAAGRNAGLDATSASGTGPAGGNASASSVGSAASASSSQAAAGATARVNATNGPGAAASSRTATGPIEIGFLNTKVSNAAAFGVNLGQTYPNDQVFQALVKVMNNSGGIAGRKIVPVIADTDTASASWQADYTAACETFTQDHKVAAVVGYSFAFFESFESCLAKAGVPHLTGAYTVGDEDSLATYPLLVATTNVTADRRYVLQFAGPLKAGVLTKNNRIGQLVDDCPPEKRAYDRSTEPFIKANGINVVDVETMSCAQGASDDGAVVAQIQSAVLRFRSRNVDTVVAEGVPVLIFAEQAESQGWHPSYLLTSTSGGGALAGNIPAAQARNMHGYGWLPAVDVSAGHQPPATQAEQRCLDMLKSQGMVPTQYNDLLTAYTTCDGLFLYEAALTATKGNPDARSVIGAINALGTRYQSVSTLDGKASFSATRHDAPDAYRPWGWDDGCSCFVYIGPSQPLP